MKIWKNVYSDIRSTRITLDLYRRTTICWLNERKKKRVHVVNVRCAYADIQIRVGYYGRLLWRKVVKAPLVRFVIVVPVHLSNAFTKGCRTYPGTFEL